MGFQTSLFAWGFSPFGYCRVDLSGPIETNLPYKIYPSWSNAANSARLFCLSHLERVGWVGQPATIQVRLESSRMRKLLWDQIH